MSARIPAFSHRPLCGIQALRAIAALAVVAYHAVDMWPTRLHRGAGLSWPNGAAGVDIFFVISGFVMVISAGRLAARRLAWWYFLKARLRRIVPLYWLCSAAKIAAVLAAPSLALTTKLGLWFCTASLLFIPVHDAAGRFRPLIPVGWTLSFEMLFYGLFAFCLAVRCRPALCVPAMLLVITLLPRGAAAAAELCNPILLEFALGTSLAWAWQRGWRLPAPVACVVMGGALGCLLLLPQAAGIVRVLHWGLPAMSLLLATLSLERFLARRMPRAVLVLGDSSYAIYLTHGFVLPAMAAAFVHLPLLAGSVWLGAGCAVSVSAAFGVLVHSGIEKPLLGRARPPAPRAGPKVVVVAGGGLGPASGGVGTLMAYLMAAWADMRQAPRIESLIDSRGDGRLLSGTLHFAHAVASVAWLSATGSLQILHVHMTTRGSALRKTLLCGVACLFGRRVIVHMHGADFIPFYRALHGALRAPLRFMLAHASHVIVLGQGWRHFLVSEVGVAPERVSIVPNGVPCPALLPGLRPDGPPRILFLGRLGARKGVADLIAALATPRLRALDWCATIAGDGDPTPYKTTIRLCGLDDRIRLPGWVGRNQAAQLLSEADMLVLPSHHEAMPIAILEALAARVAVIATPVGAIPEFLRHGETALLVPVGSPAQLADAMTLLLSDDALRDRIARAGHLLFREKMDIAGVAVRIAALYRAALSAETLEGAAPKRPPGGDPLDRRFVAWSR
jgi:peptidoglycan/LPS O-acetylase OafA/YrhL